MSNRSRASHRGSVAAATMPWCIPRGTRGADVQGAAKALWKLYHWDSKQQIAAGHSDGSNRGVTAGVENMWGPTCLQQNQNVRLGHSRRDVVIHASSAALSARCSSVNSKETSSENSKETSY